MIIKSRMTIHIVWLTALVWTTTKCEPPINSYLPPGGTNIAGRPSPVYGPAEESDTNRFGRPGAGRSGPESNHLQPQDSYFPNSQSGFLNSPDTQYGPPDQKFNQGVQRPGPNNRDRSSSRRGYEQGNNNSPSSRYESPGQNNPLNQRKQNGQPSFVNGAPQSSYGPPNKDHGFTNTQSIRTHGQGQSNSGQSQSPSSSYGPPHTGVIPPSDGTGLVRQEYQDVPKLSHQSPGSLGSHGGLGNQQAPSDTPSSSYGTPDIGGSLSGRGFQRGSDFGGEESDGPAKYEFSYDVDDAQTGTNFHHSEQRDGDVATGEYNVVLPDGRKQVVEYEAGLQGYKPQIRYEGNGGSGIIGGSRSGGNHGTRGYSQGGPGTFGDSLQGQNNEIGYPRGSQNQESRLGELNRAANNNQNLPQLTGGQDTMGYPRGGPNSRNNGQVLRGSIGQSGQENRGQFGRSDGNSGIETLNGDSQGYPSGRPNGISRGNDVGFSDDNGDFSNGEPRDGLSGQRRGGSHNDPQDSTSFSEGGTDGYPSGRPSGRRGSGY